MDNPITGIPDKEFLLATLICTAAGLVFVWLAHISGRLKTGGSIGAGLRSYPAPAKVFFALAITILVLGIFTGEPPRDEDGFTANSYTLNDPKTQNLPIRMQPSLSAPVIRLTERFEAFQKAETSGDWVRVKMQRDNVIGWLPKEPLQTSTEKFRASVEAAFNSFVGHYTLADLVIDLGVSLLFGLAFFIAEKIVGIVIKRLGTLFDVLEVLVGGLSAGSAYLIQGPQPAHVLIEAAGARAAEGIAAIVPSIMGSALCLLVYGSNVDRLDALGVMFLMPIGLFFLYGGYGYVAGWF
jgi:hypothetical protein